jgi:hypothetical protein
MFARLICLVLGHVLEEIDTGSVPSNVRLRVIRSPCARCGEPVFKVEALHDEEPDTFDERKH